MKKAKYFFGALETLSSGEKRRKRKQKEDQTKKTFDQSSLEDPVWFKLNLPGGLVLVLTAIKQSGQFKQRLVEEEMTQNVFSHHSRVKSEGLTSGVKEPETLNQTRTRSDQNPGRHWEPFCYV